LKNHAVNAFCVSQGGGADQYQPDVRLDARALGWSKKSGAFMRCIKAPEKAVPEGL
jgi:hypothetical protein